jgi:hypothetical protein
VSVLETEGSTHPNIKVQVLCDYAVTERSWDCVLCFAGLRSPIRLGHRDMLDFRPNKFIDCRPNKYNAITTFVFEKKERDAKEGATFVLGARATRALYTKVQTAKAGGCGRELQTDRLGVRY